MRSELLAALSALALLAPSACGPNKPPEKRIDYSSHDPMSCERDEDCRWANCGPCDEREVSPAMIGKECVVSACPEMRAWCTPRHVCMQQPIPRAAPGERPGASP
jgi:hypothetical protein